MLLPPSGKNLAVEVPWPRAGLAAAALDLLAILVNDPAERVQAPVPTKVEGAQRDGESGS